MTASNCNNKSSLLKNYLQKLDFLLKKGVVKSDLRIKELVRKIKGLCQELKLVYSNRQLRRILGSLAFIVGTSSFNHTSAQSFAPPVVEPFGILSDGALIFQEFADLDGDGDQDMMARQLYGTYVYYENTGSPSNPVFSNTPILSPFGLPVGDPLGFPAIADFDNDGDLDIMQGSYYGVFRYFENTGTASSPAFNLQDPDNPFGLQSTYYYAFVDAADLDNDGDVDILAGEYYGNLKYFENTGSPSTPNFAPQILNPFGLNIGLGLAFPEIVDLDNDGDLDVLVGEYYGNFKYYQNTGTASSPNFGAPVQNPFGLGQSYQIGYPASVDLDNDGDMDLMVTDYYGVFTYYENLNNSNNIEELSAKIGIFPNPATDQIQIQSEKEIVKIRILDLSGKTIEDVKNITSTVDVSTLDSGSYLIEITLDNGYVVKKPIVKQ